MRLARKSGVWIVLSAAALLAGCNGGNHPQPQAGKIFVPEAEPPQTYNSDHLLTTVTLSQSTWADYQSYLEKMGRIGGGWYAVAEDGQGGGSWSCPGALCEQSFDGKSAALKTCQAANPGKTCVIFAKNDTIQMQYDVAP
jgi:hypothetical protein